MPAVRLVPMFALIVALAGPLAATAQTPPPPSPVNSAAPSATPLHHHHRHRESLAHALRKLDLTPAQTQQIATFRAQNKQADLNADAAAKRANAAKLREQIMGVLTPAQKTQLAAEMHRHAAPQPSPSP